jgi:integrase
MGRWDVKAVWSIVKESARRSAWRSWRHTICDGLRSLGHASGGELEQIEFLFGHVSVQTTERHLRSKQRI